MDAATTDATIDSATMSATTDVATTYSTTINPASSVATMDPAVIDSDSEKSTVTLPKKRFFAEPRYISEITVTDVNTEEKAKKVITFIKQEYEKKCKEMKTLQQKNRRLKKLIVSLQELVAHLKESKLLSEDAADNFMNMLPENVKAIMSRKLKTYGSYSPEIRSFALTLHFYSPKAYTYVRKIWNMENMEKYGTIYYQVLPHCEISIV
ncbi:uncharacterized protein LOC112589066 isoform X2 [Harpegnathos saltator]|uniref:uncharacterized protein LOC112589066 isoform X2 n=1 Tax=Harpegnathos saltator TaxID=610380 RepID=UPI000DBEDAAA|nr:uncharacterized protein LOC112589066 isoform X2 [Harpegnathos saltator]